MKVDTSVRKGEIALSAALADLHPHASYTVRAVIMDHGRTVKEFSKLRSTGSDLQQGRFAVDREMEAREALGHPHAAEYLRGGRLAAGQTARSWTPPYPVRFGFREFWIDGRDFYLNGTPHLPLRLAAGQRPGERRDGQLRRGPGEPAAAEEFRHQLRLHPQLRLRAGLAPELRGDPAGRRRRGHARVASPSRTSPSTTGRCPTPTQTNGYARHAAVLRPRGRQPSRRWSSIP